MQVLLAQAVLPASSPCSLHIAGRPAGLQSKVSISLLCSTSPLDTKIQTAKEHLPFKQGFPDGSAGKETAHPPHPDQLKQETQEMRV